MKAMILAAGRGRRLGTLGDVMPKSLLPVQDKPIVVHLIERLARAGFSDIVMNVAYQSQKIMNTLKTGRQYGVNLVYSVEEQALGTGGGIVHAKFLLGDSPVLIVNADVWTDFPFEKLRSVDPKSAHLVLVNNPNHHSQGDYVLRDGYIFSEGVPKLTFSGIGVYHPAIFYDYVHQNGESKFRIPDVLLAHMKQSTVTGECYAGIWEDIGTVERYEALKDVLSEKQ